VLFGRVNWSDKGPEISIPAVDARAIVTGGENEGEMRNLHACDCQWVSAG